MITLPFPASIREVILLDEEVYEIVPERALSKKDVEYIKRELGGFMWWKNWYVNKKYAGRKEK